MRRLSSESKNQGDWDLEDMLQLSSQGDWDFEDLQRLSSASEDEREWEFEDRLSELPDDLLLRIMSRLPLLSCLPLKQERGSSVLARRWQHLSQFLSGMLNFDATNLIDQLDSEDEDSIYYEKLRKEKLTDSEATPKHKHEASPFLHKFSVKLPTIREGQESREMQNVKEYPNQNLKEVEVIGYSGATSHAELVTYLLKSAFNLEKIVFGWEFDGVPSDKKPRFRNAAKQLMRTTPHILGLEFVIL
ncbi:putative F-box/FBD/LRR-repeat protein [Corchorus capsularis]|uniref:Putative F-box/FBD/LRR-repeat protein n=1 Tax=Corchorus capsularis TaxID=210143 RepID=A0A1R3G930_COCAP|nr:putative F-box/FBD/LRR-repeat protein [Corchorus capsularis]